MSLPISLKHPYFLEAKKEIGEAGLFQIVCLIEEAEIQNIWDLDSDLISGWIGVKKDRAAKILPFAQKILSKCYENLSEMYEKSSKNLLKISQKSTENLSEISSKSEDFTPSNPCGSIKDKSKNGSPSEKKKKNNYLLPVPNDFQITERIERWATENSFTLPEINAELPQFVDYHRAKGSTFKDWEAAFYTWMRNSRKFVRPDQKSTKPAIGSNEWHEDHPMKNWRQNPIFAGGI